MQHGLIETSRPEQGVGDGNVIFCYLTGAGFEVKESVATYFKPGKKKAR